MFLIAIQEGGYFPLGDEIPPEICVIDGPALSIAKTMEKTRV